MCPVLDSMPSSDGIEPNTEVCVKSSWTRAVSLPSSVGTWDTKSVFPFKRRSVSAVSNPICVGRVPPTFALVRSRILRRESWEIVVGMGLPFAVTQQMDVVVVG